MGTYHWYAVWGYIEYDKHVDDWLSNLCSTKCKDKLNTINITAVVNTTHTKTNLSYINLIGPSLYDDLSFVYCSIFIGYPLRTILSIEYKLYEKLTIDCFWFGLIVDFVLLYWHSNKL